MMFRKFICIACAVATAFSANAQMRIISKDKLAAVNSPMHSNDSAYMNFETRYIKADLMNEDDSPETFEFKFVNTGKDPLRIHRLVSTCSCLSATCDADVVLPGEGGCIYARYNPKGHPGKFERKIFVYTGDSELPSAVLRLNVEVECGSDLSSIWPVQMGGIRLRTTEITVHRDRRDIQTISFINMTGRPLQLGCEEGFLPAFVEFSVEPKIVEDGKEGEIVITYSPSKDYKRNDVKVILTGLGLPPSRSSVTIKIID